MANEGRIRQIEMLLQMPVKMIRSGNVEHSDPGDIDRRNKLQRELRTLQGDATAAGAMGRTGTLQDAIAAEAAQRTAERGEARAAVAPAVEAAAALPTEVRTEVDEAEIARRAAEREEARAAAQPAVAAAEALPTEVMTGADVARQQAMQHAQLMGGAAGYTASPFSGRQQAIAQSAMMSAQGRYAQIAPQIDLAARTANIGAQQARAAQMGVAGRGLAGALAQVPTSMSPYQASMAALQAGQANIGAQQARAAQMGVVGVGLASALSQVPTTMSPYQAAMIAMQAGQQAGYGAVPVGGGTSGGGFSYSDDKSSSPTRGGLEVGSLGGAWR